jgi:ribonuclease G
MAQEILVNVTPQEVRVALLESSILQEIHIERSLYHGLLGNIYKGRVSRLLPGIQAAFIDIGLDRSAFLHISDMVGEEDAGAEDVRKFLTVGQEILVQVYKDQLGTKGARLTTQFTIPSRYLVLTPTLQQIVVSQKITDEEERKRLQTMITPCKQGGFIFRTAAESVNQANVDADREFLITLWKEVAKRAKSAASMTMVYEEIPIVLRVLRDLVGLDVEKIRVDNLESAVQMRTFAERYVPTLATRVEFYEGPTPIFDLYNVDAELQLALHRNINLKSGGHLVFDQTEAMTTIDVNTGSYVGHINLEQTIFRTNLEAVDIIARQIRLRNLGGIIIIDFIDMQDVAHQQQLLESLTNAMAKDSVRTQISELSSLGLVQMTRKRTRESLEHILCVPCPLCQKRGSIKSLPTVCYEIFRELQRAAQLYPWPGFVTVVAPIVAAELLNEQSTMLADLEAQFVKPIILRVDDSYVQEQFDILPMPDNAGVNL